MFKIFINSVYINKQNILFYVVSGSSQNYLLQHTLMYKLYIDMTNMYSKKSYVPFVGSMYEIFISIAILSGLESAELISYSTAPSNTISLFAWLVEAARPCATLIFGESSCIIYGRLSETTKFSCSQDLLIIIYFV